MNQPDQQKALEVNRDAKSSERSAASTALGRGIVLPGDAAHEELCYVEHRFNDQLVPLPTSTTCWACRCRRITAAAAPTPSRMPAPWPASAEKAPAYAPSSPATRPSASIRS